MVVSRPPGFTLFEVLLGGTLTALLMGLLFAFLVPTMRSAARGAALADMEQQAMIALSRMTEDLERTAPAGVSLTHMETQGLPAPLPPPGPPMAMGIDEVQGISQTGQQVWATGAPSADDPGLIVYAWDVSGGQLTRCVWKSNDPPTVSGLSPRMPNILDDTQLLGIASSPQLYSFQILATGVHLFRVTSSGHGTAVGQPVILTLHLERQAATGATQPQVFELSRAAALRNPN